MSNYDDEIWIIAVGGVVIALAGLCCKYAYKIKCVDCSFCYGFITIRRDIADEARHDMENPSEKSSARSDQIPSPSPFPTNRI